MTREEAQNREDKQSLSDWKGIVETIAAFATASGGCVRVGIAPDGQRAGVQLGKGSIEGLANKIKTNTDPPQYPAIAVEGPRNSAIVTVTISESPFKPVWAFGRPLKRVGRTNQRLSGQETQRLMEATTGRTWDALPCTASRLDSISREAVEGFLARSGQDVGTASKAVVDNLGLLTQEGLTNGAILLFARNPQKFFPDAQVKCARFRGKTSVDFIDERTFDGTVLSQLGEALVFVERNTQRSIVITGEAAHKTVPEYPPDAIREALSNAICHRDYAMPGTVQVRIYDDRLEVWNPGPLPSELSVEALYREHPSKPRNRKLAQAFHRARVIEQWGTGTLRMVQSCESYKLPRPEFVSEMDTFMVRFRKPSKLPEMFDFSRLNERQRKALAYVREHGRITTREYEMLNRIAGRQAVRDLNDLVQYGVLARGGRARSTYYVLTDVVLVDFELAQRYGSRGGE